MQSILDISINEISVHYLGHSRLETDQGFDKIHNLFIEDSKFIFFMKHLTFLGRFIPRLKKLLDP